MLTAILVPAMHQHHDPTQWEQPKGWRFFELSAKLEVHDKNATDLGQIKLPIHMQRSSDSSQLTSTWWKLSNYH